MTRFLMLLRFEIVKVMARKKAILFLLVLNVVPILAAGLSLLLFTKFKGWGLAQFNFSILAEGIKALFTAHLKLFSWIAPFFLALVIGDSLSGESSRGHLKTLLLTPISRLQILIAKGLAVMLFLLAAVMVGGIFLQGALVVARIIGESPNVIKDVADGTAQLITSAAALKLLAVSFIGNLPTVCFFLLFALFADSPILMAFSGLFVLMTMQVYVMAAPTLAKFDAVHEKIASWCFTRHPSSLFDVDTIQELLTGSQGLRSETVTMALQGCLGWAVLFFLAALFIFRRKPILN